MARFRVLFLTLMLGCAGKDAQAPLSAQQAEILAAYTAELQACLLEGKAVNSIAVYERCTADVQKRYGVK